MTQLNYAEAVEYLTERPEEMEPAWTNPRTHTAGKLFLMVRPHGEQSNPDGSSCACLTMVRGGEYRAWNSELTKAIHSDERIPTGIDDVTEEMLPIFAAWQTYLDSAIRGVDPTGVEFCPIVLDLARKAGAWLPPQETVKPELPEVVLRAMSWSLVFQSEKREKVEV